MNEGIFAVLMKILKLRRKQMDKQKISLVRIRYFQMLTRHESEEVKA